MQKPTTYQQLQPEDRITIATMRQRGLSVWAIARTLERAPSTIVREVACNTIAGQSDGSHHAQLLEVVGAAESATLKRVVRHDVAYMIVSPVFRKEEKPAVSSAVVYRRMRSWQRLGVKPPGQCTLLARVVSTS